MRAGRAVIGAVALLLMISTGAAAAPSGVGEEHANVHATLIDVDVFEPARGGRPAPTTANCSNDGATSATDYAFTGWVTAGGTAHLNVSTVPSSLPNAAASLQAAFSSWSNGTGAPAFAVATDGTVTRQTANRQADVMFGKVSGGAIAVTYTWRWSDGLIESDMVYSRSLAWRELPAEGDGCYEDQPYYDFWNIAEHEIGHMYGLGHPGAGRFETMYRYGYTGETLKRSPGAGDLAGLAALY